MLLLLQYLGNLQGNEVGQRHAVDGDFFRIDSPSDVYLVRLQSKFSVGNSFHLDIAVRTELIGEGQHTLSYTGEYRVYYYPEEASCGYQQSLASEQM